MTTEAMSTALGQNEQEFLIAPASVTVRQGRLYWVAQQITRLGQTVLLGKRRKSFRVEANPRARMAPTNLVTMFAGLKDSSDDTIARFAAEWGVLGICKHNCPRTHQTDWRWSASFHIGGASCRRLNWTGRKKAFSGAWEPLDAWRAYISDLNQLLSLAAVLQSGKTIDDLRNAEAPRGLKSHHLRDEHAQKQFLAARVNEWLALGAVRPRVDWGLSWPDYGKYLLKFPDATGIPMTSLPPTIRFGNRPTSVSGSERMSFTAVGGGRNQGATLFGAIAWQLALLIARTDSLRICRECRSPFVPTRRVADDRDRYCTKCGRSAAVRAASRRYRDKTRSRGQAG